MPKNVTILTIFVASPDDVLDEREVLEEVIREFNISWGNQFKINLELVRWETHSYPGVDIDTQEVINKQIGENYDIFIGIMWKKFGTPTGRAGSGTVEEFNKAYKLYKKNPEKLNILFYFKNEPIPPSDINIKDLEKIEEFRNTLGPQGTLFWFFKDTEAFKDLVRIHLTMVFQEWRKRIIEKRDMEKEIKEKEVSIKNAKEIIKDVLEEDEDEAGFLELVENVVINMAKSTEIMNRMRKLIEVFGNKINERTEEMAIFTKGKTYNIQEAKKLSNLAAKDMDQFSEGMEKEIPLFSETSSKALNSMVKSVNLLTDFKSENKKDILDSFNEIKNLKETISFALSTQINFRNVIASLPRITTKFNKSKKNTLKVIDTLIDRMGTYKNLTIEIIKAYEDLLADENNKSSKKK